MEASGARRPERGTAYLRWQRRSRAVAPASWASAFSPARRPSWWPWRPPRERFLNARRPPWPAPPRSAPAAASAATGRGRLLSARRPPPRGRRISRTPPLATPSPAARCVCLSDLSVPGEGGVWERAGGTGTEGWGLTSGPSFWPTPSPEGSTPAPLQLPAGVVCC